VIITDQTQGDRSTIFLNDPESQELYSRKAEGKLKHEIRILNTHGIAGFVFSKGEPIIVHDVQNDPRFEKSIDEDTGYDTRNMLCLPIQNAQLEIIGVVQVLNKKQGRFTKSDLNHVTQIMQYSSFFIQSNQAIEKMQLQRRRELDLLNIVSEMSSEIRINVLLQKVMNEATRMLDADRSTLFLNDEKTNQLWSQVSQGLDSTEIRFPNHLGIAGAVFQNGVTINIPHAYADMRFNPAFDKQTGFFTKSILCVPIVNQHNKIIGVTQVLNKRIGAFNADDEARLKAFTAKIAIALQNADLFAKEQNMKNYNSSMLQSMTNGVLTLNEENTIITCNKAGANILGISAEQVTNQNATTFFGNENSWVLDKLKQVVSDATTDVIMDAEITFSGELHSVNLTLMPLIDIHLKNIGSMIMIEDISSEKRMKSTMSRYIDPSIASQLLSSGGDMMGGKSVPATVLFSDIRGFTTLSEKLGPQGTVNMLNDYFELMVDCITKEGGMLDKFIGDAIMAAFGIPLGHEDDEDRALRASISMIRKLKEWNVARLNDGKMPIDIGIGLNTDTVVSGNIGSKKRMDYTIIGDGVNLAARLESACKQYAAKILISEFTFKNLKGTYRTREVDFVVVKGKTQPVAIYEVLDYHDESSFPNLMDAVNQFREGIQKYRAGKWSEATNSFNKVLELHPEDKLSEIYIHRCKTLQADPPAQWDGVWVMEGK
jgi:adenylate cyclase